MKFSLPRLLIHIFVVATVLGVFLIPLRDVMPIAYGLGAGSWFLAVGLTSGGAVSETVGILLSLWIMLLPLLLIIFYILAFKDQYLPMFVLICVDALIMLIWHVDALRSVSGLRLEWEEIDAPVSVLFTVILAVSLYINHRLEKAAEKQLLS